VHIVEVYLFLPVLNALGSAEVPSGPLSFTYSKAALMREFDQVQAVWAV